MGTFTLNHTTHIRFHLLRPRTWFVRHRRRVVSTAPIRYDAPAVQMQRELAEMGMQGVQVNRARDGYTMTFGGKS